MTTTVIERSKWYRGLGHRASRLLNDEGQMCCLGFDSLRRGFTPEEILNVGSPGRFHCELEDQRATGLIDKGWKGSDFKIQNSPIVNQIIQVNDDTTMNDRDRELVLTHLFSVLGTIVRFV